MWYSLIAILAAIVHVIINHDVLRLRVSDDEMVASKAYRRFCLAVMVYFITDIIWGILEEQHLYSLLYVDTAVYFIAMATTVFLWTRYVISYLENKSSFGTFLYYAGYIFFIFAIGALVVNFFQPIIFTISEDGTYVPGIARYMVLGIQTLMFLWASLYTLFEAAKTEGAMKKRYLAIGMFGVVMITSIAVQFYFPYWPLYSIGCLLGTCILHSYVVENEKDEYRRKLEELIEREKQQERELGSARHLAYSDSLTGVKNTRAYSESIEILDRRLVNGKLTEFAVAVFDLNDLKTINDTMGHEIGDISITDSCKLICHTFQHSPVYRIGGDEFVAILEESDYADRVDLLAAFDKQVEENLRAGKVVVASGMAEYDPLHDKSYHSVFERADMKMYLRKQALKEVDTGK